MDTKVIVKVVRDGNENDLTLPIKMSSGAAGFDLSAAIKEEVEILPMERKLIPTGIRLEIPEGYEGQVRPRSGLALEHGVTVLNSPGTIDSDYRGEVKVILINLSDQPFFVSSGDRIAQLVIQKNPQVEFVEEGKLSKTSRGCGGFGHTGR
jgi:dUTP pyrophosphatase